MDVSIGEPGSEERARHIMVEEVERLLDDLAPEEADAAALYVEAPGSFRAKGSDERAFGIPGAGFAALIGPLLVAFVVMLAKGFLEAIVKVGTESAVSTLLQRTARELPRPETTPDVAHREKTLVAITTALIEAGWDAGRAGEAAEKVWRAGLTTGQRLAEEL